MTTQNPPTLPRPTRIAGLELADLELLDEWLGLRHEALLDALDDASVATPTTRDGTAPTTVELLQTLQRVRRLQVKVGEAKVRCNTVPEGAELDEGPGDDHGLGDPAAK